MATAGVDTRVFKSHSTRAVFVMLLFLLYSFYKYMLVADPVQSLGIFSSCDCLSFEISWDPMGQ